MWYQCKAHQLEINIYVKPNAKRTALVALHADELHIALHAKPKEGEANATLLSFIADFLRMPKKSVVLLSGHKSRHKKVSVPYSEAIIAMLEAEIAKNISKIK